MLDIGNGYYLAVMVAGYPMPRIIVGQSLVDREARGSASDGPMVEAAIKMKPPLSGWNLGECSLRLEKTLRNLCRVKLTGKKGGPCARQSNIKGIGSVHNCAFWLSRGKRT